MNTYEDTQKSALPESFATLDQQYAGTAVISTVNTFKMDEKQVLPGSKVILTMTDGSNAARFIRTDGNPLYYYGTDKVVEALGFDVPIEVAAEDLIAGIRVYSGGAYTIKYQTAPSKVFFDYADGAAENAADAAAEIARRELAEQYGPYWNNQVAGKASGATAEISGAAAGTVIKSLIISGGTSVGAGAAEGQADAYPAAPSKVYMCGTNLLKLKQDTRTAGGLTMSCDGDLIAIGGKCTGTNLYVLEKLTRFDVPFTLHVQVLTGSATGAGMYFTSNALVGFKTQTRYFPNGITNWKGSPDGLQTAPYSPTTLPAVFGRRRAIRRICRMSHTVSRKYCCLRAFPSMVRRMASGIPMTSFRVCSQAAARSSCLPADGFFLQHRG